MVDLRARDNVAEAHHVPDVRIAVLAHPLADGRGLEARRARHVVRVAIGVGRRAHVVARRAVERVARQDRGVAVRLRQHPYVREAEGVGVPIADAALMLGIVVLEEHHGFVGRHQSPRGWRELVPGRTVGVQL